METENKEVAKSPLMEEKTITLTQNDWNILCASLQLTAENVGRLAVPSEAVGNIHKNCTTLVVAIEMQLSK